jgi:hypothetical protein
LAARRRPRTSGGVSLRRPVRPLHGNTK